MKRMLILLLFIVVIAAFQSCYYDKAELVYPTTSCDTTNIKYTGGVQSIINAHCDACHAGNAAGAGGIKLDAYTALRSRAISGALLDRITTTDPSVMMPKGGPRLSDCEINKIRVWINNGTPN